MKLNRLILGAAALALCAASAAFALVVPQNFAPRMFPSQQVHYLRFTVNFNDCTLVSNQCSVKRGAVPYNAWITRIQQEIITNFNSGTGDDMAIGTKTAVCAVPGQASPCGATSGLLMAPVTLASGAGGATTATVLAGSAGINATGAGDTSTGGNGGFDIWTQYFQTGAAPSAGVVVYVIEYIAPNDGSCANVSGATAAAC